MNTQTPMGYESPLNKYKRHKAIRRARLLAARALGTHNKDQWLAMVAEFQSRCVRCGSDAIGVEKDHITPLYQGGSDSIDNIQPFCAGCNVSKGAENFDWKSYRREFGF